MRTAVENAGADERAPTIIDAESPRPLRWLRMLAIATAAMLLASCRALPTIGVAATSSAVAIDDDGERPEDALQADGEPLAAVGAPLPPDMRRDVDLVPTGLEAPCPPLPRLGRRPCGIGGCRAGACPSGLCGPACTPVACVPEPAAPVVGPYLVCDGGDACAPGRAVGKDGLKNLTASDTVARYRPASGPDADEVRIVASNCACVFAPRFGAVREVTRPLEDAVPQGPRGLAVEQLAELEVERLPVRGNVQTLAPEAARKALPGVAVEERLGPLAVDQGDLAREDDGVEGPVERVLDEQPELARRSQRPLVQVGFDVPVSWTCIKAANVLANEQEAQVVAVDRGVATLRFEEPGRAELTLCKRAGSDTARVGEELDFTIFMLNSGDRPLTGIVLADALPMRLRLVPDSAASSLPAAFSTETGDDGSTVLTWRLEGTLRPGESGFVRFRTIVR